MRWTLLTLTFVLALFAMTEADALTPEQAKAMALGDTGSRIEALQQALKTPDAALAKYVQALSDDSVKTDGQKVWIVGTDGGAMDPVTQTALTPPEQQDDIVNNNRMRSAFDAAQAVMRLFSPQTPERLAAAKALLAQPGSVPLAVVTHALVDEKDADVAAVLQQVQFAEQLASPDVAQRLAAAKALAKSHTPTTQTLVSARLGVETDPAVKSQLDNALREIRAGLAWGERLGALFTGISLGSIFLLIALGLAITYGLMGVINMAHGELMMIGAYATYMVQQSFTKFLPGAFDYYLLVALPVSFLVSAGVGAVLERSVIRFLYGRPLETLLATWGISLVLMQAVRSVFGAQNVGVENPLWMSGGWQLMPNLILPWNRVLIVGFALAVLAAVAGLIGRTRLGLFVRGVTQNRPMAACMGVNTARIDTYAFALGSGIAGLAGCALSQIGNVGPDLGQSYIVDSFMVVVLGGVGQLAGTVYASLGLGMTNKLLEGLVGAVLAKIAVLIVIIIVIQKKPQGLFALKGRVA